MVTKPKLTTAGLVSQSVTLVDTFGFEALNISAVAKEIGVAASALYTYFDDLNSLRNLVAVEATDNLTTAVHAAATGIAGQAAILGMGAAYEAFAIQHRGQFSALLHAPTIDNDDLIQANQRLHDIFALVYAASGLEATDAAVAAIATRSAIHGHLALCHNVGTTAGQSADFETMLSALTSSFL